MTLRLKEFRLALGLSQQQLANKSGLWRESINRYERGKMFPDLPAAMKLAKALGCTVDELVREEDQETAS